MKQYPAPVRHARDDRRVRQLGQRDGIDSRNPGAGWVVGCVGLCCNGAVVVGLCAPPTDPGLSCESGGSGNTGGTSGLRSCRHLSSCACAAPAAIAPMRATLSSKTCGRRMALSLSQESNSGTMVTNNGADGIVAA